MSNVLYDNEVLWMYNNAPLSLQHEITDLLVSHMAKDYKAYRDACDKGYSQVVDDLITHIFEEMVAIRDMNLDYVFMSRKLSNFILTSLNKMTDDFVYLRICAYGNTKLTMTFVTEDNKASSSMPSLFTDEDELSHVIDNIPVGTFCYYKTVYLRKEGTDVF